MPHEPEYDLTFEQAIEQTARDPASFSADGMSATSRNVREMIEADKYLAAKEASDNPKRHFGLRVTQLIPPGAG